MMEAGVVIDIHDQPIFWHVPTDRTGGSLPDSRQLWDVLWDAHQRGALKGFAHTHPGSGVPGPSSTDIETFRAIEQALGRPLEWWITSHDNFVKIWLVENVHTYWVEGHRPEYVSSIGLEDSRYIEHLSCPWLEELRRLSNY